MEVVQQVEIGTLHDLLKRSAERYADHPALVQLKGVEYTYRQLAERVLRLQTVLSSRGIGPGDRVAIVSENKPDWGTIYLAVTGMKAVIVPILPDFSASEIAAILRHAEVSAVFVSKSLRGKVGEFSGRLFSVDHLDLEGDAVEPSDPIYPVREDLAAILYTSGTTGKPKGVMLSHDNIVSNVLAACSLVHIGPGDRLLSILPLAHTYECTIGFLAPLYCGSAVFYLGRPPTLSLLLPALAEVRPSMMMSVPLIIEKLYRSRVRPIFEKNGLTRLIHRIAPLRKTLHRIAGRRVLAAFGGRMRFFGIGGAPLSAEAERFLRESRFPYAVGYGLTETSPLIAGTATDASRFRCIGPTVPGVQVRIDHTNVDGKHGEIQVKGPNVMLGYFKNEEATADVFTSDGWLRTGDLGSISSDGYVSIRGRLKNMILGPGGENIYPDDIEAAINEQEMVVESVVFEWQGELIARVHLDMDAIREKIGMVADVINSIEQSAQEILTSIRSTVNARVARASRLSRMILELEPFEKTPTQKIKRFRYTELNS